MTIRSESFPGILISTFLGIIQNVRRVEWIRNWNCFVSILKFVISLIRISAQIPAHGVCTPLQAQSWDVLESDNRKIRPTEARGCTAIPLLLNSRYQFDHTFLGSLSPPIFPAFIPLFKLPHTSSQCSRLSVSAAVGWMWYILNVLVEAMTPPAAQEPASLHTTPGGVSAPPIFIEPEFVWDLDAWAFHMDFPMCGTASSLWMHSDMAKLTLLFLTKICAMLLLNIRMFPHTTSGALIDTFAPLVSNSMLSHITEPAISSHQYLCLMPISLVTTTSNPYFGDHYHSEYGWLIINPFFFCTFPGLSHMQLSSRCITLQCQTQRSAG